MEFPSRSTIIEDSKKGISYQDDLIGSIKSVDLENIDFSKANFKPRTEFTQKQKVFFWIRLYLKDDNHNITPDDTIIIKYPQSGEELSTKFICYAKKGLDKDSQDQLVNYDSEDDKKILCLMVDADKINYDNEDIPFIKTLFKTSRFYEYQLLKRDELLFINMSNNESFEYFDVSF